MLEHHHHEKIEINNHNRAFVVGILLNTVFVLVEAGYGFYYNSLALLSDAGHNLSDVASLLLALLAYRLAKTKPTTTFTYGYRKSTVLVSLINAVVLLIAVGSIFWESISRFRNPEIVSGGIMALVAGVGIIINSITAYMFLKGKEKDLNIKGAYLHMAADALVSLGVVIAGIIIIYTNWYWLDGAIGVFIALVILVGTVNLLRDSFNLSMDAVPKGINIDAVQKELQLVNGVISLHHIHIWAISTTFNSLTAHIVVSNKSTIQELTAIKMEIRHRLAHLNIAHSTLEFEIAEEICDEEI